MMQHERATNGRVVSQYELDTLGAPFKVTLHNCVSLNVDAATGQEMVSVPDLVGLIGAVVRARVSHARKLNGEELKFVRNALNLRANRLADFLDMSPEHLSRCEAGSKIMSTTGEKFFRLFAFLATSFPDPDELLDEINDCDIEKMAKKPNETAMRFAEQFLRMKIQSVYDANEELHFEFVREPSCEQCDPNDDGEWKDDSRHDEPVASDTFGRNTMALTPSLMVQIVTAPTGKEKATAVASLIMWFAMGAFITSIINSYIPSIPDGLGPDFVGGLVGLGVGAIFKAV